MVSIQSGSAIAKNLFAKISFEDLTLLRVGFSALILAVFFKPWKVKLRFSDLKTLSLYGAALGAMNFFFYKSLQTTPVGVAVAIEFLGPLAVALIYSKSLRDFLWVVFAAVGIYLILPDLAGLRNLPDLSGYLYAGLAGLFWALYIIFGKKTTTISASSFQLTSLGMIFSFLTVVVLAGVSGKGSGALNISYWHLGIMIALLSSAIPYGLEMIALAKLPEKSFGILMSLEPAIAALMAFLWIQESLSSRELLGIVFVIVASLGTTLFAGSPQKDI